MALYSGKAVNARGEKVDFSHESQSRESLSAELKAQGLYPIRVKSKSTGADESRTRRFSLKVIIELTDSLRFLLSAGLSLKDALAITLTIFRRGEVHDITAGILDRIQKGSTLHQALGRFDLSFPPIYRGLIRIGEKVGSLENIFQTLAEYLKERKKLKDSIIGAMLYPSLIIFMGIVGMVLFSVVLVPKFSRIFEEAGTEINTLAQRMDLLNVLVVSGGIFLLFIVILILALKWIFKLSLAIRERWDTLVLKIPLIGKFSLYRDCLSFLFAMETLTESGYPVEDAVSESCQAVGNLAIRRALKSIETEVKRGRLISQAFLNESVFQERIGRWLVLGERSGHVGSVFRQLRQYYQEEITKWTERIMNLIGPVLIIIIGVIILIFIMTFIVPVLSIYSLQF